MVVRTIEPLRQFRKAVPRARLRPRSWGFEGRNPSPISAPVSCFSVLSVFLMSASAFNLKSYTQPPAIDYKLLILSERHRSYLDKSAHLPDDTPSLRNIVCPCLISSVRRHAGEVA